MRKKEPSPFDILVGFNFDLDTSRSGSGQIYFKNLNDSSITSYLERLNPSFIPTNIFMITYDNVLPYGSSNSRVSFQLFLTRDAQKSYAIFKYAFCPNDLNILASSGLNYNSEGKLEELRIKNRHLCLSSNLNQNGVWVSDVTSFRSGNFKLV